MCIVYLRIDITFWLNCLLVGAVSFGFVLEKIIIAGSNLKTFFFCYRVDEKTKKCSIPFVKPNRHSLSGIYNINVTTLVSKQFSVVEEQTPVSCRLLLKLNMIVKN